jgi:hypothetical protein
MKIQCTPFRNFPHKLHKQNLQSPHPIPRNIARSIPPPPKVLHSSFLIPTSALIRPLIPFVGPG